MQLPTYIENENQENYNEEFNQTLRDGLSDSGWTVPNQSAVNIAALAPNMPIGTIWYNTDINKLQVLVGYNPGPPVTGIIETITSV